ncbi:MAG: lysophospholipid acyltransferase family protein [Pseudomonadales bacterium]
MRGKVTYFVLWLFSRLPRTLSQRIGRGIGYLNYHIKTRSFLVTRANLQLCFPDMDPVERDLLTLKSLISTGQTLMETPTVWLGSAEKLRGWIKSVSGREIYNEALEGGKGVIILLPHVGNWELFNTFFANIGKMTALYHPPRQQYLRDSMIKIRSHFGNELVATNIKGIARLYRVLGEGGVVTILPDQIPSGGIFAGFMGVKTLSDKLVSRLLKKTGAAAVVVSIIRDEDGLFHVAFDPADESIYDSNIEVSVSGVNKSVELCLSRCTEQYQWEYKRFRERPKGELKIYRFGKADEFH